MLKNKIILSSLFLVTAISCSNFKPLVLTNALLDPKSKTNVDYEDINWSYALFNQYASGLNYELRINYSTLVNINVNQVFYYVENTSLFPFTAWDTVASTYAEASLDTTWKNRLSQVFFNREFVQATKLADTNKRLDLFKRAGDLVNLEIIIKSKISYSVNIGSLYLAYANGNIFGAISDQFNLIVTFYDRQDNKLQDVLLENDQVGTARNRVYDLSNVITNVARFDFKIQWIDIPPYIGNALNYATIYELNLFTQNQEIAIPDNTDGDLFGFEFVAVEWWNILGHLQNFMWWIVNKSPIRFIFEFIDTYIISFVEGFIDIITGVFNL